MVLVECISGVLRRLPPSSFRYYPYDTGTSYALKEDMKVEDVGGNSVQWEFVSTTWDDFVTGILVMHRLVLVLDRKDYSFDDPLLSSAIAKYKQVLKKLEDKLRSARDVSEANRDLFTSIFSKPFHSEILQLPPHSPYILGTDFAKQELKEEVVQLGVDLSLYVAQSMFLLCDDVHSVLWFCYKLWGDAQRNRNPDSPVVERLLCVIHYVYLKYIIPKNGVFQNDDGKSVLGGLISATWKEFDAGIRDLDRLVQILRGGENCLDGRELTSSIEQALKNVDEKLRCVKDVSEANGFVREALESSVLDSWKTLFDNKDKKVMKNGSMLGDLFLHVCFKAPPC
ncbi:hypothetical protein AALP_AAs59823U000200 [Arabis alpina]|uniref:Uncharacterized protein n=1 Tax=Arabis alpina TaxID=50452 RepID=A0A087G004_ARAAL|nr:hypothetical protein AALP_AAs59823U000200 [Arabis alpina]